MAGDSTFYELAYGRTGRYPSGKWEFTQAIERIQRAHGAIPHQLRVLEIGAGSGAFLRQLMERGVDPGGLAAIEYSLPARRQLEELGLGHVGNEALDGPPPAERWRGAFDVVAMFQVLEHLDSLDSRLDVLSSYLRPSGELIVGVPNPLWIRFHEEAGGLLDQPPNHVTCFTLEGLTVLAERAGLRVAWHRVQPTRRLSDLAALHYSRYQRRSQTPDRLAARVAALSNPRTRQIAALLYLGITLPIEIPHMFHSTEGMSLLAGLRRPDTP